MEKIQIISTEDVQSELKNKSVHTVFLDVRTVNEFKREHIQGFINIPLFELFSHLQELQGKRIVISCFSGYRAKKAARIISDAIPSSEVLCFRGSLRAWERQGNQVVGTAMLPRFSIEQQFFMLLSMILLSSTFFDWGYIIIFFVCSGLLFAAASGKCMLKRFISKMPWNKGVFD